MEQTYSIGGPQPGDIGWLAGLHGRWYAEHYGFGIGFEAVVATIAGDIVQRLAPPRVLMLVARDNDGPLATLSADLDNPDASGRGRIRIVIAEPCARGRGVATRLLNIALDEFRTAGAKGAYLDTFHGLEAARKLYHATGFKLVSETEGHTWGPKMIEQRFELDF
jgi:GNAT superfamily N-acetyltransferase